MKVINLSWADHANFAYNNCLALNAAGVECHSFARNKHPYGYTEQSAIMNLGKVVEICSQADVDIIQIFHSDERCLDLVKDLGKKLVVYHTGTTFRQNAEHINRKFNPVVEMTLTDSPEFMFMGCKNIKYVAHAVDTDKIKPVENPENKIFTFGHFPSRAATKGTPAIKAMMAELSKSHKFEFICDEVNVSHGENLKRIAKCDAYIEMFATKQGNQEYGSFGVTAFEVSAMGIPVITNMVHPEVYENAYGVYQELFIANSKDEFSRIINLLLSLSALDRLRSDTRNWIVEKHSLLATGNYLKSILQTI